MRQHAVDHRGLGDDREDAHGAPARGTRQRVNLVELAQQLGPPPARFAERERHGAATTTGVATGTGSALCALCARRLPRLRLAYQPE